MALIHLPTMTCGGCLGAVTRAIQGLDHTARVEADMKTREIAVTSTRPEPALLAALRAAGFRARPILQPLG